MIVTKELMVKWNRRNRKYYENKGYLFTKTYDQFKIPIEDIYPDTIVDVNVKCDDCGQIMVKKCLYVFKSREENNRSIDLCKKCEFKRKYISLKDRQNKNELAAGSVGYWTFFENRKQSLLKYIDEHGHLNNMHKIDNNLYCAINRYDGGLKNICDKIGVDWSIVKNRTPRGFYDDFENVKEKIELFISNNDRFPTQKELIKKYKIQLRHIKLHGGMDEVKRKMNYSSENDLLDSNGYYNKSLLEYQTAEFLIKNGISYKRETMPFPGRQIKCDFEIETVDSGLFFVEVWGYSNNDIGFMAKRYNAKRQEKLNLYKSKKFNLIELEYDVMQRAPLEKLNKYFIDKFKDILSVETVSLDSRYLLHPKSISDEELVDILLSINKGSNILPTYSTAKESSSGKFIREAVRRYGTYKKFADAHGLSFAINKHDWNDDTVNEFMLSLVKKGLPITRKNIESHKAGGLFIYIRKTDRNLLADRKLDFYEKFIDEIDTLPSYDLSFLEKIAHTKDRRRIYKIDPEDSKRAKTILNKYHSKIKHDAV